MHIQNFMIHDAIHPFVLPLPLNLLLKSLHLFHMCMTDYFSTMHTIK